MRVQGAEDERRGISVVSCDVAHAAIDQYSCEQCEKGSQAEVASHFEYGAKLGLEGSLNSDN